MLTCSTALQRWHWSFHVEVSFLTRCSIPQTWEYGVQAASWTFPQFQVVIMCLQLELSSSFCVPHQDWIWMNIVYTCLDPCQVDVVEDLFKSIVACMDCEFCPSHNTLKRGWPLKRLNSQNTQRLLTSVWLILHQHASDFLIAKINF